MAQLARAVASLRISGDDLVPEEITGLLGSDPTHAERKGQAFPSRSPGGVRIAATGQWHLQATETAPGDLDSQVSELLGRLTQDLEIWRELSRRFAVDLFCGWFMELANEGITLSPQTLRALGERGIELGLDIYGAWRHS